MIKYKIAFLVLFFFPGIKFLHAQDSLSIPAFTAYALPAEPVDLNGESTMFDPVEDLKNWTDVKKEIQFYFKIRTAGRLELSLMIKNEVEGNILNASFAGKEFTLPVPRSKDYRRVRIGSVEIKDTGFYMLQLRSSAIKGNTVAEIRSLELSGTATERIHFNPLARRNAASVHLFYPLPDSMKAVMFYTELTIPENADILHSYYMACGFSRGYFGIQVNSETERRVIFSVWDAGNEPADRAKVQEENKVQLVAKGEGVFADGFGNEGTGGHSHWVYPWKTGETYRFMVSAAIDSTSNSTTYAGYFFIPELHKWKLIACFKAPRDGKPLRQLYSFVENFEGNNGQRFRKAFFGNPWIRRENGEWKEITTSRFSFDATGRAGDRIDYGGGTDNDKFYLWNGGFHEATAHYGDIFTRPSSGIKPVIDLYKNADSALESAKEKELIYQSIRTGHLDTSGSTNGIYYKILKEGEGELVSIRDTVVVFYKGTLLNGAVFDETKDKPATFPVKRLIKGMQTGLALCRKGGRIRLVMPSAMAYSTRNLGSIPPNSILLFDVEILDIRHGKP